MAAEHIVGRQLTHSSEVVMTTRHGRTIVAMFLLLSSFFTVNITNAIENQNRVVAYSSSISARIDTGPYPSGIRVHEDITTTFQIYLPLVLKNYLTLPTPTLISPMNDSTVNSISPLFRWKPNADPNIYYTHFWVSEDPNFSTEILSFGRFTIIDNETVEEDLMWNLQPSTTYYWHAFTGYDTQDLYSEVWFFTTGSGEGLPAAPVPIAPPDGSSFARSASINIMWQSDVAATDYLIWVETIGCISTCRARIPQYTYFPYFFQAGTYKWKVAVRNDYGWSEFSAEQSFTVQP